MTEATTSGDNAPVPFNEMEEKIINQFNPENENVSIKTTTSKPKGCSRSGLDVDDSWFFAKRQVPLID